MGFTLNPGWGALKDMEEEQEEEEEEQEEEEQEEVEAQPAREVKEVVPRETLELPRALLELPDTAPHVSSSGGFGANSQRYLRANSSDKKKSAWNPHPRGSHGKALVGQLMTTARAPAQAL
eukprot:4530272-Pyramimonas_sp.AAC.1